MMLEEYERPFVAKAHFSRRPRQEGIARLALAMTPSRLSFAIILGEFVSLRAPVAAPATVP